MNGIFNNFFANLFGIAVAVLNRSGVFNIGGELNLNLVRDWKQEIGAEYMAFSDGLLSDKDAFDAVSYTHLDVYKRQVQGGEDIRAGGLEYQPADFREMELLQGVGNAVRPCDGVLDLSLIHISTTGVALFSPSSPSFVPAPEPISMYSSSRTRAKIGSFPKFST